MITSPVTSRLTAVALGLSLIGTVATSTADAKGPAPEPDFTISVFTGAWDWASGGPVGTFSSSGVINDVGDVYYLGSYYDAAGDLWNRCLFVGVFGAFACALPARPENGGEYPFDLGGGTDGYLDLNAAGIAKVRTKKGFVWYDDPSTFKQKLTYLDVSWTMRGFLSL